MFHGCSAVVRGPHERRLPLCGERQPRVPRVGDVPPIRVAVDKRRRPTQDGRARREGDPRHRRERGRAGRAGARARRAGL
eukprot:10499048-Alexandrium_andersonii.AAC.1